MVENNYQIATRHCFYSVLGSQLTAIIRTFFGDSVETLAAKTPHTKPAGYLCIDPQLVMNKHYDSKNCRLRA